MTAGARRGVTGGGAPMYALGGAPYPSTAYRTSHTQSPRRTHRRTPTLQMARPTGGGSITHPPSVQAWIPAWIAPNHAPAAAWGRPWRRCSAWGATIIPHAASRRICSGRWRQSRPCFSEHGCQSFARHTFSKVLLSGCIEQMDQGTDFRECVSRRTLIPPA